VHYNANIINIINICARSISILRRPMEQMIREAMWYSGNKWTSNISRRNYYDGCSEVVGSSSGDTSVFTRSM